MQRRTWTEPLRRGCGSGVGSGFIDIAGTLFFGVNVGGSLLGGTNTDSGAIHSGGGIFSTTIGHNVQGGSGVGGTGSAPAPEPAATPGGGGTPGEPTAADVLATKRWVLDPAGAPSAFATANTGQTLGDDPIADSREVFAYVENGGKEMVARFDPRTSARVNQPLEVVADMGKMHIFDRESEKALVACAQLRSSTRLATA